MQSTLPGMTPGPAGQRERRRRIGHVRVWDDAAIVAADGRRGSEALVFREAFVRFLSRLPPERLAELRGRLGAGSIGHGPP